jgi:hypothetical protein
MHVIVLWVWLCAQVKLAACGQVFAFFSDIHRFTGPLLAAATSSSS